MCSLALTACNDDDSIIDRTGGNNLQVEVSANFHSRAPIHESTLPDNNPIGVTLTAKDGSSYDNQNYNNIPYSATTADGKQTWMPQDKPVTLSVTEGVAMAYWPYNADAAGMTAVPVETGTQTDYMYSGNVTGLTNATPKAAFQMKHAMTLIRVNVVRGTYTAEGAVTAVTAASEAFCTSGTMNVSTGALAGLAGAETPFLEEPADAIITTAGRVTEFLVLPDVTVDAASVALGVTVDGRKYNTAVEVTEAFKQGYIYTYNLTLDNTALNVSAVAVTPWDLQSSVDTELNAQDDQYIVQVTIDSDNYNYIHNIQNFVGTIDWGDGTVQNIDTRSFNIEHNYAKAGKYIVAATGKATALNSNTITYNNGIAKSSTKDISNLIHIGGEMGITDMSSAFLSQRKIKEINSGIFDGLINVFSFRTTFSYCENLESIPEGLFDKCTEITTFDGTFLGCKKLTSIPTGLFDNCTKVVDFLNTFRNTGLISIPEGLFDYCTEVDNFQGTFQECKGLTGIPTGLFDNNTKVTNFRDTFFNCTSLKEISTALFDNNIKVTTFQGTFSGCEGLTSIPQGLFDKCTEITNFGSTFYSCKNLTNIPEGLVDNCTKVTEFGMFFGGCSGLTSIPAGLFDNCPEVTNFGGTFYGCSNITGIPAGLFDKNTKVTNFNGTFNLNRKLAAIPEGLFDNCPEVTNFGGTFFYCTAITEIPAGLFNNNTKVTTFASTFYSCSGVTRIPEGLFDNCSEVTTFNKTFWGCTRNSGIPEKLFDNNVKAVDFTETFQDNQTMISIPEGLFNKCTEVTTFQGTFKRCFNITKIPTGLFDKCTKVINFKETFAESNSISEESPYTIINVDGNDVKVHLYERSLYPEHFAAPTSYTSCFKNCTGIIDYSTIVAAGWN